MSDEIIEIVDDKNKVIGKEKRSIVLEKGLLHRAINLVLVNSRKQIFLQKRSAEKKVCPLTWDLSASEHMKPGESYEEGARRGLKEELGINAEVTLIRKQHLQKWDLANGLKEHEFVELFLARFDGKIKIDKKELDSGRFFSINEIKRMIRDNRDQFTPWFLDEWPYIEKID